MRLFRKIPLPGKLFLLVLFPMVLIVLLTIRVYQDNNERVRLIGGYVDHISLFADLSATATQLQVENRLSYMYALKGDSDSYRRAKEVRAATDSLLALLDSSEDPSVANYRHYTFLDSLGSMRRMVDQDSIPSPDAIMHYYTTSIFRIKTIAQSAAVNNHLLDTVFEDLTMARILNDMFMYLGLIRSNFYSALYQKRNNILMLYGLQGSYDVLRSYENELKQKANPDWRTQYNIWKNKNHVRGTLAYIDTIFSHFSFDTLMDAEEWWRISGLTNDELRGLQQEIVDLARSQMENRYSKEIRKRNIGLFVMIISLVAVLVYMFYTSRVINSQLNFLDGAARKIAVGEEAPVLPDKPEDVIGRLASSIERIDFNNKKLAHAATQIGKGNFEIEIKPRGSEDALGLAIAAMKDDLQEYIAEIHEHERRKDDFIVMASHELKTPITSIKGYVQLLLELFHEYQRTQVLPSEGSVSGSLYTIDKQINKLTRLLSELLDLTRIERGRLELEKKKFSMNELLKETIDEVGLTAPGRELILEQDGSAEVFADRDRVGQVILNLLTNALKYSKAPEPVHITVRNTEDKVSVSVRDKGIGISPAEQEKIFERFYRVQGKSEQTYPGFGIGLFIASEIVRRHGGVLKVESEPGKGSVFEFTLDRV